MKRLTGLLIVLSLVLCACGPKPAGTERKQYTATFLNLFDTVTTIVGRAESEEAFQKKAQAVYDVLEVYHQLFDIYNDYEGVNNLKTINDQAGVAPVQTDPKIIDLLEDCREYYERTGGRVNVCMGSVLALWHEARSEALDDPRAARLPDEAALKKAAQHVSFDDLIVDEAASTVYIADPEMRLDVGAIAKGWAVQKAAEQSPEGLLISVGGNVCATGPKDESGTRWVIGIQDPDGEEYLHTLYLSKGSVVTSGDYQRTYAVGDELYHHIIDPDTLFPAKYWRSVTVVAEDSGLADALSTALFTLPLDEGMALAQTCGVQAMWVSADGSIQYTPEFETMIRT